VDKSILKKSVTFVSLSFPNEFSSVVIALRHRPTTKCIARLQTLHSFILQTARAICYLSSNLSVVLINAFCLSRLVLLQQVVTSFARRHVDNCALLSWMLVVASALQTQKYDAQGIFLKISKKLWSSSVFG
jgi:hypothetical protein